VGEFEWRELERYNPTKNDGFGSEIGDLLSIGQAISSGPTRE